MFFRLIFSFLSLSSLAIATPPPPLKKSEAFKSFTGKLNANKVRVRAKPDLESPIVRQMNKNDLLLVVGETDDFYAVAPLKDTKAYIFRSYVLDQIVEASRVNVRLEPHIDAPIIGQLQAGQKVQGVVSTINNKWLEISPPPGTRFYVAKEFVSFAGGPEHLANMEKRRAQVEELLNSAYTQAETECKKEYEKMAPHHAIEQFQNILRNFADFPEACNQAKEGLALLKETYLNKKIAYLESKTELSSTLKEEMLSQHQLERQELLSNMSAPVFKARNEVKEEHPFWHTLEESLFLSWSAFHSGKTLDEYYTEQKANALVLSGTIEPYTYEVQNKPGDFILRKDSAPIAYLYSTQLDLSCFVGKDVTLLVAPRPNNHFAFPAYFVFSVE